MALSEQTTTTSANVMVRSGSNNHSNSSSSGNSNGKQLPSSSSAASSESASRTGAELYLIGDTAGALDAFDKSSSSSSSFSPSVEYNRRLLSHVVSESTAKKQSPPSQSSSSPSSNGSLVSKIKDCETHFHQQQKDKTTPLTRSARKRKRNDWIMTYNQALALQATGNVRNSVSVCLDKLKPLIRDNQIVPDELIMVTSRTAFLLLEGILALSVGYRLGIYEVDEVITTQRLVQWLDSLDAEGDPQLRFLLSLYKSRLDFGYKDNLSGKLVDAKLRSARKELKQAMEIFQHKLRPTSSSGDSGSLGSSSEDNSHPASTQHNHQQPSTSSSSSSHPIQPIPDILQAYNQAALNLKANIEQLKGNMKKSLILCAEAQAATDVASDKYDSMHANNLAIVYETNGRRHLALHTMAKALKSARPELSSVRADGTTQADSTLSVLYNASICAAQAQNFLSAYECMATCIQNSTIWASRPRCWLRAAEACIGLYAKHRIEHATIRFSSVEVKGEPKGILLQNSNSIVPQGGTLSNILASPEDIAQVQENPLLRARSLLETAIKLFQEQQQKQTTSTATAPTTMVVKDGAGFIAARLSFSYILLECKEYTDALEHATAVLNCKEEKESPSSSSSKESSVDLLSQKLCQRQLATARMYAAEASCALGDAVAAMRWLVGDGKDDAFDRLASDLAGVTIGTAATHTEGKVQLAKAQSMVRASASAVSARLGNIAAAKQLAMSAQAMEDVCSVARERSAARRALIYCMLREGNCSGALTLLRSVR